MAGTNQSVTFTFTGDATGVQEATKKIADALNGVKGNAQAVAATTVASGVLMADALKKVATEALNLAKSVFGAFTSTADQVRALQRTLGGTAEDMSHLSYVSNQLGVDTDSLSRATVILFGHLLKNDDAAKRLGVSIRDSAGNIKPTVELLGQISDRLNMVSDSQERAALTRELFGRQGLLMLPILQQGSAGLKEFAKQADELGLTMSQKDVNASYQFGLAVKEMKASVQGVGIEIGRVLLPVLKAFVDGVRNGVEWIRNLWGESNAASGILKTLAAIIGAVAAAALIVTAALKVWAAAQVVLNAIMDANPIGLVIIAIFALGAGLIALVKNFKPVGEAIIILGLIIGTGIGWGINIALKGIKGLVDGLSSMLDAGLAVAGAFASLADAVAGFFGFDTGLSDKVNAVRRGLGNITGVIDTTLDNWAKTAKDKGGQVGESLASGLVSAIENLHMPTMPTSGANPYAGSGDFNPDFTSGGGKGAVDKRVKAIQDFFKQLIDSSRAGLNELRQSAIDARKQMADTAKNVAKSISDSFSISDITESSFAAYNGIDRLTDSFNRRLTAMTAFVRNIKKLIGLGLPMTMLVDMVNAGPDKGGAAAQLLADNPQSIADFRAIQASIDSQSSAIGQMIGQAQYGGAVADTSAAAAAGQAQFRGYLGAASGSGYYTPTAADLSAASGDVYQEINVNVDAPQASPQDIAAAVAWAAKTSAKVPARAIKKAAAAKSITGGPLAARFS